MADLSSSCSIKLGFMEVDVTRFDSSSGNKSVSFSPSTVRVMLNPSPATSLRAVSRTSIKRSWIYCAVNASGTEMNSSPPTNDRAVVFSNHVL